jgi:hypothetical protein
VKSFLKIFSGKIADPLEEREGVNTMKMNSQMVCLLLCVFTFLATCLVTDTFAAKQKQAEIIVGTVVKTDEGLIIEADDGDYLIKGKDLSKMIDKVVEVTGYITETATGYVINVKKVEELQE